MRLCGPILVCADGSAPPKTCVGASKARLRLLWGAYSGNECCTIIVESCTSIRRYAYVHSFHDAVHIYCSKCAVRTLITKILFVKYFRAAVLYDMTKTISHVLSLTLTLHHSLAPNLPRLKSSDPHSRKFDNAPPEVAFAAVVIVVMKLVYGLDGAEQR